MGFSKIMKIIFLAISILFAALTFSGVVFAHINSSTSSSMETIMRQMMGDSTFDTMEQIEEQMMGAENHERTEALMDKMFEGGLSADEQKEVIGLMQDAKMGAGAMAMMMRQMMPNMMQNTGFWGWQGMMGKGALSWGIGFSWFHWITLIIFWLVLLLAIIALIKFILKK